MAETPQGRPKAARAPSGGRSAATWGPETLAAADRAPCPCGRAAAYADCCGRWHAGPQHLQAPDAESLMRSRYSAFVRGLAAYLLDTWHPSTRPPSLELEPGLCWLGLEVKRHVPDGERAIVEFVARSKHGGRAHRLHETSRFVREGGRWFYVDALPPP